MWTQLLSFVFFFFVLYLFIFLSIFFYPLLSFIMSADPLLVNCDGVFLLVGDHSRTMETPSPIGRTRFDGFFTQNLCDGKKKKLRLRGITRSKRMPIKSCEMLMPFKSRGPLQKEREWHYHIYIPGLPCHHWPPRDQTLCVWTLFLSCLLFLLFPLCLLYVIILLRVARNRKRWDLEKNRASPVYRGLVQ